MHSNLRLTVLSKARTKAQVGCYAGGTTPRQSRPGPSMLGLDVTPMLAPVEFMIELEMTSLPISLVMKSRSPNRNEGLG
jgi:hypothetical protein